MHSNEDRTDVYDITDRGFVEALFGYVADECIRICEENDDFEKGSEDLKYLGFYLGGVLTGTLAEFRPMDRRKTDAVVLRLKSHLETYPVMGNFHKSGDDDVDWAMSAAMFFLEGLLGVLTELGEAKITGKEALARQDALIAFWTNVVLGEAKHA